MAFREVPVIQVKEAPRRWLQGAGERPIAQGAGLSRGAVRRYIAATKTLGLDRVDDRGAVMRVLRSRRDLPARVLVDGPGVAGPPPPGARRRPRQPDPLLRER